MALQQPSTSLQSHQNAAVLGGSSSDYNKLENKIEHHYFDAVEDSVDISQLNDMSFGEETHSTNETFGNMPQMHGKLSPFVI